MTTQERQRRRNFNERGHAHELTFSCFKRYPLLASDRSCGWLRESLDAARISLKFELWAYVFMPEHVHLIVRPCRKTYDMAKIRQAIKEPVSRTAMKYLRKHHPNWLPKLAQQHGERKKHHFWLPGGGYDRNVDEPKTLMAMLKYIHLNPVRRGLVENTTDWQWSSAGELTGNGQSPIRLDRIPPEWLMEI